MPRDLIEMFVGLDGECLVPPLINVAGAALAAVFLPTRDVGHGQPLREGRQVAIVPGLENRVPMVGITQ